MVKSTLYSNISGTNLLIPAFLVVASASPNQTKAVREATYSYVAKIYFGGKRGYS